MVTYSNVGKFLQTRRREDLKSHCLMRDFGVAFYHQNVALFQLNTIWVSCEGESPADVENIGPITYIPTRGFPGYFYPYKNSEGYLSPVMAIHFQRPRSKSDSGY